MRFTDYSQELLLFPPVDKQPLCKMHLDPRNNLNHLYRESLDSVKQLCHIVSPDSARLFDPCQVALPPRIYLSPGVNSCPAWRHLLRILERFQEAALRKYISGNSSPAPPKLGPYQAAKPRRKRNVR